MDGVRASVLALGFVVLGGPVAGSAAGNSGGFTYQVNPIAVRAATTSQSAWPYTPEYCSTNFGLACYTPQVFHSAYQIPWLVNGQLAGTGEKVAIVDAYGSPTVASDLQAFDAVFGLPPANLHVYYPDGKPAFQGTIRKGLQASWAEETSLDVQTVHDIAPGAQINLIVAGSPSGNVINNAISYAVANHLGDVLSMSFGSPETLIKSASANDFQLTQSTRIFAQAVKQGVSLFASSGDNGASAGYATANASYPASDPNVTATGGTDLFVNALTDPTLLSTSFGYSSETTWNDSDPSTCPFGCTAGVIGATGGAPSSVFSVPGYQAAASGLSVRSTSDVSFNSSVYTGSMIYLGFLSAANNGFYFFGGTSEASPSWAAITADLNQAHGSDLGAMNPILYGLAANATTYASDFHDVTVGNNKLLFPSAPGFSAATGYDIPTGLGSPNVAGLMNSLEAPGTTLSYSQP